MGRSLVSRFNGARMIRIGVLSSCLSLVVISREGVLMEFSCSSVFGFVVVFRVLVRVSWTACFKTNSSCVLSYGLKLRVCFR